MCGFNSAKQERGTLGGTQQETSRTFSDSLSQTVDKRRNLKTKYLFKSARVNPKEVHMKLGKSWKNVSDSICMNIVAFYSKINLVEHNTQNELRFLRIYLE